MPKTLHRRLSAARCSNSSVGGWWQIKGADRRFEVQEGTPMFQLINGCIECAECRNEILYTDEFTCSYCRASLCDSCLLSHEEECALSLLIR